jgi:hypothetical protein
MEYEVFYGCNLVGSLVVALIVLYHLLASKPIISVQDQHPTKDFNVNVKKQQ